MFKGLANSLLLLSIASLAALTAACPEAQGWYRSRITNLCYRCLRNERLNFVEAQRKCNSLRSNLFQFNVGDTKIIFDDLQQELADTRNTTEFREAGWIGLTDRAVVDNFVYLNGFSLNKIAPDTLITCSSEGPNCRRTQRCVYLNLGNRNIGNRQVFKGDCESTRLPPICYAPVGGTDRFDQVPVLGAQPTAGALASLTIAGLITWALLLGGYLQ